MHDVFAPIDLILVGRQWRDIDMTSKKKVFFVCIQKVSDENTS